MTDTALAFVITGGVAALLFLVCLLYKLHIDCGTYTTDLHQCEKCQNAMCHRGDITCSAIGWRMVIKVRKCPDYSRSKGKRTAHRDVFASIPK